MENSLNPEVDEILYSLEASYWVPVLKTPFDGLDVICGNARTECPALFDPLMTLVTSLRSAKELLDFPYMLIVPYVLDSKWMEKLSPKVGDDGSLTSANWTNNASEEDIKKLVSHALHESGKHFINTTSAVRLMHQAYLLIWGAFEVYCKEVFLLSLNERPELFLNIQKKQDLKDRFAVSQSNWLKLMESHKFNLNGVLGTYLAQDRDFSSPQLIRDLFSILYEGVANVPELLEYLSSDALWKIGQRRHLIAHKCGIVDQDYLDKTNDSSQALGQLLVLKGRDIVEAFGTITQCVICIEAHAIHCWPRQKEESAN